MNTRLPAVAASYQLNITLVLELVAVSVTVLPEHITGVVEPPVAVTTGGDNTGLIVIATDVRDDEVHPPAVTASA